MSLSVKIAKYTRLGFVKFENSRVVKFSLSNDFYDKGVLQS